MPQIIVIIQCLLNSTVIDFALMFSMQLLTNFWILIIVLDCSEFKNFQDSYEYFHLFVVFVTKSLVKQKKVFHF